MMVYNELANNLPVVPARGGAEVALKIYIPLKWKLECLREFQIFLPLS